MNWSPLICDCLLLQKPEDVDVIELLGGSSRVPRLQAQLAKALKGRHLDKCAPAACTLSLVQSQMNSRLWHDCTADSPQCFVTTGDPSTQQECRRWGC